MGFYLNTNASSLTAQRCLGETDRSMSQTMERLSTGMRINRANDDAAGLSISEGLKASLRSMSQARRAAIDGISMLQTAEGGLAEIQSKLIHMRALAVQAANGMSPVSETQEEAGDPVTLTFNPIDDAFVDSGSPDTNFDSWDRLSVDNDPDTQISYLKFNVSGIDGDVTNVTLKLFCDDDGDAGSVRTADSSWDEGTVTYNTRPGNGGTSYGSVAGVLGWNNTDITGAITAALSLSICATVAVLSRSFSIPTSSRPRLSSGPRT